MGDLLTVREVAATLRVSKPQVYKMAANGILPAVRYPQITGDGKPRRMCRFRAEDIEKFKKDNYGYARNN